MIRIVCVYGLVFKYSDGFTHDLFTLIPALKLAYKTSINFSTGKTTEMLEKGFNPGIPHDTLKKDLVDINPTASSSKIMLDKETHHSNRRMQGSFKYQKERWDKSHKPPDSKVGDLALLSTLKLNSIKGQKKLKYTFAGPFMIKALHSPKVMQVELPGELMDKQKYFLVSLIKPYSSSDKE
ncbi:hypothetical protein O181_086616 [Austropuccinia psidii MF-1]|uniref:Uncharacterized protein n=1 Tax=Austropuccinia psidii MF-1 TaxID=1389203 RepID=A0A9Q3FV82_9BASI|nr:hypothetical protein [Austropuccinia psidii MF-1]